MEIKTVEITECTQIEKNQFLKKSLIKLIKPKLHWPRKQRGNRNS